MSNQNIQMKKNTNGNWDNLYPFSISENIHDSDRNKTIKEIVNDLEKEQDSLKNLNEKNTLLLNSQFSNTPHQPTKTIFVAHRGLNKLAPENTIPAIDIAGSFGVEMIEIDVRMTSDNVPILMHDETVDRMTDGIGSVASKTYNQIKQLTVTKGTRASSYPETKVPSFEEYLLVCKKWNVNPFIHLYDENGLPKVIELLKKYRLEEKCVLGISLDKTKELRLSGNVAIRVIVGGRNATNVFEMDGLMNVVAGTLNASKEDVLSIHNQGYAVSDYNDTNDTKWRTATSDVFDYYLVDGVIDGGFN